MNTRMKEQMEVSEVKWSIVLCDAQSWNGSAKPWSKCTKPFDQLDYIWTTIQKNDLDL